MKIVFATHNKNKLKEVQCQCPSNITLVSLEDIGCYEDIPEEGLTLEENAMIKAKFVYKTYHTNCFSDDTGLEVKALKGAPGVLSARYAGLQKKSVDNISKLLENLQNVTDRKAVFKTVIALIIERKQYVFEGVVEGEITPKPFGQGGFGYDSVFLPKNFNKTFAQMSLEEKNTISHRGKAINKLMEFLASQ